MPTVRPLTFRSPRALSAAGAAALVAAAALAPLSIAAPAAAIDPAPSPIAINEVESSAADGSSDFVELVNTGQQTIDLTGYTLRDDGTTNDKALTGLTIAPGEHLAVDVKGLGGSDSARLFGPGGALVDSYSWTTAAAGTYGRCPDSTGPFRDIDSTKGAPNVCPTAPVTTAVVINEVESNGGTPGDWVELFNTGTTDVDLAGWVLKNSGDTNDVAISSAQKYVAGAATASTVIRAGGFLAVDVTGLGESDSARLVDPFGVVAAGFSWTRHAATTYGRVPDGTGAFQLTSAAVTKGAPNVAAALRTDVKVNEVQPNGSDFAELFNTGITGADLSGYIIRDDDDTHTYVLPAGTIVESGGWSSIDFNAQPGTTFGLSNDGDAVRLFAPDGTTLVDGYTWSTPTSTALARCPDGTGAFVAEATPTKNAANSCSGGTTPPPPAPATEPFPGGQTVTAVDDPADYSSNLSGLKYEHPASGPDALWAVQNGPGTLFKLQKSGAQWRPAATWTLRYADGTPTDNVDAEGVTITDAGSGAGVYVSSERNNFVGGTSRPSVLLYQPTGSSGSLNAVREWNLAADLPGIGANAGLEGVTWIPDAVLTSGGFVDTSTGSAYNPAAYPLHGTGVFVVAVENTGVFAYVLNSDQTFRRIGTIASPFPTNAEVQWEPQSGRLWVVCDDACDGRTATFALQGGAFVQTHLYARATGLKSNFADEGFTIAPAALCVNGVKPVFWADDDDGQVDGSLQSLREGTIECASAGVGGSGGSGGATGSGGTPGTGTGTGSGAGTGTTVPSGTTIRPAAGSELPTRPLAYTGVHGVETPVVAASVAMLVGALLLMLGTWVAHRRRRRA